MSEVEQLIEKVVKESGKSEKEVRSLMEKRKEATHGLLSDYGAIYAVAKEFGVGFNNEKPIITKLSDIELQKAFNVVGRVKAVYPPRTFERKDGSKGKFSSIVLIDDSGEIRLTLWDNNSEIADNVSKRDIIFAKNVYGRAGMNNETELHATSLTNIRINPELDMDIPKIKEKTMKIKDIKENANSVDIICRISEYYPVTEFERKDSSVGYRASFVAEDETGKIRAVLWDDAAKKTLTNGDFIRLENAHARKGLNEGLELHLGNRGRIMPTEEKIKLPSIKSEKDVKIADITTNMSNISLAGRVLEAYKPRAYSKGMMSSIMAGDESGVIRIVLWDEKSNITNELKKGDAIKIRNTYSRSNLDNEPELHIGKYGEISINPDLKIPPIAEIEKHLIKEKKIIDLENKDRYIRINGKIVDIDNNRRLLYMTCPYCNKKIQHQDLGYYCEPCDQEVDPVPNMVLSLTMEDDTGSIRAIAFKDNAEKILDMDVEEVMNLIGETQDEFRPITDAKEDIIDQSITLIGRVKYSDFSDRLEFIIDEAV